MTPSTYWSVTDADDDPVLREWLECPYFYKEKRDAEARAAYLYAEDGCCYRVRRVSIRVHIVEIES